VLHKVRTRLAEQGHETDHVAQTLADLLGAHRDAAKQLRGVDLENVIAERLCGRAHGVQADFCGARKHADRLHHHCQEIADDIACE